MSDEITPRKKAQRKYEIIHKEERKLATGQFNTRLPRAKFDEINNFLKDNNIPKIKLIYAGYEVLRKQVEKEDL